MASKLNSALLNDIKAADRSATGVIPLFQVRLDPSQPRKLKLGFAPDNKDGLPIVPKLKLSDVASLIETNASDDATALARLAVNVLQEGVLVPITVSAEAGSVYRVITGERRVTAALLAREWAEAAKAKQIDLEALGYRLLPSYDYDTIPAAVSKVSDDTRFRVQIAENLLRQDMSAEDLGRAWKKMLDDGLFPNVHNIAKHFGWEETKIQAQIDMVDMAETVAELKSRGIVGAEIVGRLLSDLRVAQKKGVEPRLYNRYVQMWDANTQRDEDGEPIYPSERRILDLVRKSLKKEDEQSAPPSEDVVQTTDDPQEDDLEELSVHQEELPAEVLEAISEALKEIEADESAVHTERKTAPAGESAPRAPKAPAPDSPHQTSEHINIDAFSLSREQARIVMAQLGAHVTDDEVTARALIDAITTFRP
jgi:ParB-like chromosome segregation protein Spo0J